jgi:hypothetical protein
MRGAVLEAAASPYAGVPIGILIGVLSGVVFMLLLNAARTVVSLADAAKVSAWTGLLIGLWFGGSWLRSEFFAPGDAERIRDSYLITLTVSFLLVAAVPLFNFVRDNARGPRRQRA